MAVLRCVDMVKSSQYVELANDLEINKAITYLRQKDFNQVSVSVRYPPSLVTFKASVVPEEGEVQMSSFRYIMCYVAEHGLRAKPTS